MLDSARFRFDKTTKYYQRLCSQEAGCNVLGRSCGVVRRQRIWKAEKAPDKDPCGAPPTRKRFSTVQQQKDAYFMGEAIHSATARPWEVELGTEVDQLVYALSYGHLSSNYIYIACT